MPSHFGGGKEPPPLVKKQTWLNPAYIVSFDEAAESSEGKPQ
jgi:hypothetical protein